MESKQITALLIQPQKMPKRIKIENTVEAYQKEVDGYFECLYIGDDPVVLLVNEEGKIRNFQYNRAIRDSAGRIIDIIAGPFLIVGVKEDDFCSLSNKMIEKYEKMFHTPEFFMKLHNEIVAIPAPAKKPSKEREIIFGGDSKQQIDFCVNHCPYASCIDCFRSTSKEVRAVVEKMMKELEEKNR